MCASLQSGVRCTKTAGEENYVPPFYMLNRTIIIIYQLQHCVTTATASIYNVFKLNYQSHHIAHRLNVKFACVVRYHPICKRTKIVRKSENNRYWLYPMRTTWMLPMINESQHFTWTNWANWFELETFPIWFAVFSSGPVVTFNCTLIVSQPMRTGETSTI